MMDVFWAYHDVSDDSEEDDWLLVLVPELFEGWSVTEQGQARDALQLAAAGIGSRRRRSRVVPVWRGANGLVRHLRSAPSDASRYLSDIAYDALEALARAEGLRLTCPGFWRARRS